MSPPARPDADGQRAWEARWARPAALAAFAAATLPIYALVLIGAWHLRRDPRSLALSLGPLVYIAVIHMVFHGLPNQRMRLRHDAHRSLRRIWATRDRVSWPPKLIMHPHDLTPLAMVVGEQSSFERAVPARS